MSLIVPFNTESLTKRWPQTSSSSACFVNSEPACRTSAHSKPKGVGERAIALPPRSRQRVRLVELELAEAYA